MSVRSQGSAERLDRVRTYEPGDELYFRADVDSNAELALVRVTRESATVVHSQGLAVGNALLSLDAGQPLAWRVEAGEGSAIFALLAQPMGLESEALSWEEVGEGLEGTYDLEHAEGVCGALLDLELSCSAEAVRVKS